VNPRADPVRLLSAVISMKSFVITKNDSGQRADKFLLKAVPDMPKSYMYRQIRKKNIKLNGGRCDIGKRLKENDVIELYINDCFFENSEREQDFLSAPAKLDIIYEDENIILTDKKPGLPVHSPDGEHTSDTLINRIKRYLYDKGEYSPENENSFAPALCNRIDRNTGGIVIAAKNAEALRLMNEKIKNREIEKRYLCVTVGVPPKKQALLTAYIEKDSKTNTVKVTNTKTPRNKTAVTEYKILRENGKNALLEVTLHTGRTHQIRAHMAHIGYPLLGDGKYGSNKINREFNSEQPLKIKAQALYSYKLKFAFKVSGGALEKLNGREFTVPEVWFSGVFDGG